MTCLADLDDDEMTVSCCEIVWVIHHVQVLLVLHPGDARRGLPSGWVTSHLNLLRKKLIMGSLCVHNLT